ncbi:unnamed protein product, partial [Staurois parvus]
MSLKYTSIISSRCLTGCKVESLIAWSTRWPALVLQLIRQLSPTIAGQSIPDTHRPEWTVRSLKTERHRPDQILHVKGASSIKT